VEARDVVELMDTLGLARAVFVGTSRGGLIAMLLAATVRDRLQGVVLNDIGPVIEDKGLEIIKGYVGIPPKGSTYDDVAAALLAANATQFPGVPLDRWRICAERWFEEVDGAVALRYDPRLRDAMLAAEGAEMPDLWPMFDALEGVPLAVLRGANSELLSRATVDEMARRRPDMLVAEVPDRGHVPFLDEPEAVQTIRALIRRALP
jgi:pimeloyl-ACP methyl ester carboxylesterase